MIGLDDFQTILANTLFDGSMQIAGIVIFAAVIVMVLSIVKKTFVSLVVMIPVTLIFYYLGILSTDLTVILIIVVVLGLAMTAPKALN